MFSACSSLDNRVKSIVFANESDRLSTFCQRLQSLSDSFYSTSLQDSKEGKVPIRNSQQLEQLTKWVDEDFTFDQSGHIQR